MGFLDSFAKAMKNNTILGALLPDNESSNIQSQLNQDLANIQNRKAGGNQQIMTAPPRFPLNAGDMMKPETMNPYASGRYSGNPQRPSVAPPDDGGISDIMQQITKLLNEGPQQAQFDPIALPTFDPNKFKGQATQIVNEQFDPVIANLEQQQVATQGRAKSNQTAIGEMYNQLAGYVNSETAGQNKQYDAAQNASRNQYADARDDMAGMYAADAAAQREQAKKLGTEAFGVNEALAQQTADQRFTDQMMQAQGRSEDAALEQQQLANQSYGSAMQGAAKSQGAEGQQDVIRQLEDYMMQSDANIAGVQSQAAGSINDLMMKLAQGTYDRDLQNAQFGYQQQRDYIGDQNNMYDKNLDLMMKQLELSQAAQGTGSGSSEKLNPWQQTATFAEQLQPGQGQNIVSALQQAMNERPEIYARSKEDPVPMTPALFAKLIGDSEAAGNLDQNSLRMAAQELYRLLYGT